MSAGGLLSHTFEAISETAAYFGDHVLTAKQIYKVVDGVFDIITGISEEENTLPHDECVSLLMDEPLIKKFVTQTLQPQKVRFSDAMSILSIEESDMNEVSTTSVSSVGLTPLAQVAVGGSSSASRYSH